MEGHIKSGNSVIVNTEQPSEHVRARSSPANNDPSIEANNTSSGTIRVTSSVIESPVTMAAQDDRKQASDSLSLLRDTLPGFKSSPSPPDDHGRESDRKSGDGEPSERSGMPGLMKGVPPMMRGGSPLITSMSSVSSAKHSPVELVEVPQRSGTDEESDSEIDEDALSIIIAVEGEEEDSSEDMQIEVEKQEDETLPILRKSRDPSLEIASSEELVDLTVKPVSSSEEIIKEGSQRPPSGNGPAIVTTRADPPVTMNNSTTASSTPSSSGKGSSSSKHSKPSAKVKQFFTTLQMFGNRTSQEVAEQVQELITALVVRGSERGGVMGNKAFISVSLVHVCIVYNVYTVWNLFIRTPYHITYTAPMYIIIPVF